MTKRPAHLRVVGAEPNTEGTGATTSDAKVAPETATSADVGDVSTHGSSGSDLEDLYRRYSPYVAAIAGRILGRDHEVDDLVQDTFVNALRGLSSLREPAAVKGWLAKITVRLATRRLKRRRVLRALRLVRDDFDCDAVVSSDTSPEQRALIAKIYRVLDKLPAEERVAFVLRHVEGEPLYRIPELCGCSLSTAQRRLARAQALLERELRHD